MPEIYFNERIAAGYDAASTDMFAPAVVEPVVSFLAELAGDGAALELGIGTGRIALPLSQRDVPVCGIDLSPAMVGRFLTFNGCRLARPSGRSRCERWSSWNREPFTRDSGAHRSGRRRRSDWILRRRSRRSPRGPARGSIPDLDDRVSRYPQADGEPVVVPEPGQ